MKKPEQFGNEHYNYKDFFPGAASPGRWRIYRFLLEDVGSSGSQSDGQIHFIVAV